MLEMTGCEDVIVSECGQELGYGTMNLLWCFSPFPVYTIFKVYSCITKAQC